MSNLVPTSPDYGISGPQIPAPEVDLAEVAARLNSTSRFRRTGRLIHTSPFYIHHNGWIITPGSTNIVHINDMTLAGPASLKMNKLLAGSSATLYRYLPFIADRIIGNEITFAISVGATGLVLQMVNYINTDRHISNVMYNPTTGVLSYWSSAGVDVALKTYETFDPQAWHNLKFTVNIPGDSYRFVEFDNDRFDLTGTPIQIVPSSGDNLTQVSMVLRGVDTLSPVWLNDYIYTIDEP